MLLIFSASILVFLDQIKRVNIKDSEDFISIVVINYALSICASFVTVGINLFISQLVEQLTEF
jgi:ABC-type tungstate transport system permease subunit